MSMKITTPPTSIEKYEEQLAKLGDENASSIERSKHLKGQELSDFYKREVSMRVMSILGLIKTFKGDPKHADRINEIARRGGEELERFHETFWNHRKQTEQMSHQVSDQFAKISNAASKMISFAKIENPRAAKTTQVLTFPETDHLKRCLQDHPIFSDTASYYERKLAFDAVAETFSNETAKESLEIREIIRAAMILHSKMRNPSTTILRSLEAALTDCAE